MQELASLYLGSAILLGKIHLYVALVLELLATGMTSSDCFSFLMGHLAAVYEVNVNNTCIYVHPRLVFYMYVLVVQQPE